MLNILGPKQDTRHGKYLGLPSIIGRSKTEVFVEVKEKVGWKGKLLSIGGKEILIKAVAQAVPTYTMSCFLIPKGLCEEIEGMIRKFWWGQRQDESKIAWVSWEKMCKAKSNGGMGFRNLQAFNLAMLTKQGWRLLSNPDSLCAKVLKARYYPNGDVLNSKVGSNPSYTWRSIVKGLEVIRKGTRWRVGYGRLIHIWEDKWLSTPTTYKACVNALPTLLNLRKRGVNTDGMCPVCGLEFESIYHALVKCVGVKNIWDMWKECPIVIGAENMDFSNLALKMLEVGTPRDMELLVVIAWVIWHGRNLRVFESVCQEAVQELYILESQKRNRRLLNHTLNLRKIGVSKSTSNPSKKLDWGCGALDGGAYLYL
ncbi:hypothetical protein SO802_006529 [Lithocarpus litseifolius]|uniref:Reverse transcriptase zinc-binding domain-containing protein n=1 Tax=Lithocarpus litseifolius TaxID=425828 RepID=A0AAW2DRS9_9ROSI